MSIAVERQIRTLDMVRPKGRSSSADEAFNQQKNEAFGPAGSEFSHLLRLGHSPVALLERYGDRIDEHFFNFFADEFHPGPDVTVKTAFTSAQGVAIGVVKDYVRHIPRLRRDPLRSEISRASLKPSHLYLAIEGGQHGEDVDLSTGGRRQFMLILFAAEMDSRSGNGKIGTELTNVEYYSDEYLYEPGKNPHETFFAYHEQGTNTVRRVVDRITQPPARDEQIKAHELKCRVVPGIGLVNIRPREKNLVAATKKGLTMAALGDGVFRSELVQDYMGIKFVTNEGKRDQLMKMVKGQFVKRYRLEPEQIKEDHTTQKDRGQAGGIIFKRLQIPTTEPGVLLEGIFQTFTEHFNSQLQVGEMGEDGFLNGKAHPLYELRRDDSSAPVVVDREYCGVDIHAVLRKAQHTIADDLKEEGDPIFSFGLSF